jgi:hypothetical protein
VHVAQKNISPISIINFFTSFTFKSATDISIIIIPDTVGIVSYRTASKYLVCVFARTTIKKKNNKINPSPVEWRVPDSIRMLSQRYDYGQMQNGQTLTMLRQVEHRKHSIWQLLQMIDTSNSSDTKWIDSFNTTHDQRHLSQTFYTPTNPRKLWEVALLVQDEIKVKRFAQSLWLLPAAAECETVFPLKAENEHTFIYALGLENSCATQQ